MRVAIIGAGVAGLCAAIRLKETASDLISDITVFEKNDHPGGLLQSTRHNGHWWDNGAFKFGRNNYLVQLMPDVFEPFEGYRLKVWHKGALHDFPFGVKAMLTRLSVSRLAGFGLAYGLNLLRCGFGADKTSLERWLQCRLTGTLLRETGLDAYVTKLQGRPPGELSYLFGEQRLLYIHKMTRPAYLLRAVAGLAGKRRNGNGRLVYPRDAGVGSIAERLAQVAGERGIRIRFETAVTRLGDTLPAAPGVVIECDGPRGKETCKADYVISTMAIDDLVRAREAELRPATLQAYRALRFMDLQMSFFIVREPKLLSRFLTLYSFEKHHRWKRLVARSLPDGTTSVLVETTFDPLQTRPDPGLLDQVAENLTRELKLFTAADILCSHAAHVPKAYPVYVQGYEKQVEALASELETGCLTTVGRNGRFLYSSTPKIIDQAIRAADDTVRRIADGRKRKKAGHAALAC